jgi:hypothetical protein
VRDIKRFSPHTWSMMELKSARDLDLVERLYASHEQLGDLVRRQGGRYFREFDMTNAAKHFVARRKLEQAGLIGPGQDTRDPRVRARLRCAGYLPLYEGRSFWLHNPYFGGTTGTSESVSKFVTVKTATAQLPTPSWNTPRLVFRDITHSSTNQRTLIAALMPPGVHGNKAPSIDGLGTPNEVLAILASMTMDYIVRMKVYVSVNWFHAETLPIPSWSGRAFETLAGQLVLRLNAVGQDFEPACEDALLDAPARYEARLLLEALVADLFGIEPEDLAHIVGTFPIYDRAAPPALRFGNAAVQVFSALTDKGVDAAREAASRAAYERSASGTGFQLDEIWAPAEGWNAANEEARSIVEDSMMSRA